MSKGIKAIGKDTVHRICSGQVVLNLANAVKELVENSLDAQASIIEVRLKEYGSELIEVIDNGSGVHSNNFEALTLKHHTSKLSEFEDLITVDTFGFRGEALSSLCALCELSVVTKHELEHCGSKITFDHMGHIKEITSVARQVGTTVSLSNIFSTLPVRHAEFNRNLKKEFVKMTQLLSAYCLVAVNVKITCTNQNKNSARNTLLSTQGSKTVRENISCVFGSKQLSNLMEIIEHTLDEDTLQEIGISDTVSADGIFKLSGFISNCGHGNGRSSSDRQYCYINSRPCDPPKVMRLINEIYRQFNQHQFPFVFLDIAVPKSEIDINVTPDKRLIFLQHEKLLLATIKSTLLKMYNNIPSTYKMNNVFVQLERPFLTNGTTKLSSFKHSTHNDSLNDSGKKRIPNRSEQSINKQMRMDLFTFSKSGNENCEKMGISSKNETSLNEDNSLAEATFSNINLSNKPLDACMIPENESKILNEEFEPRLEVTTDAKEISYPEKRDTPENCQNFENNFKSENDTDFENMEIQETSIEDDEEKFFTITDENEISENCIISEVDKNSNHSKGIVIDATRVVDSYKGRKCVQISFSISDLREKFRHLSNQNDNTQKKLFNKFHAEIDPDKNDLAENELSKEITKDMFEKMSIIGQFNLGFIITRLGPDLFIIDQHASDEKYNFEMLQKTTILKNQKLVIPQNLELTSINEYILLENLDIMQKNGFEFEINHTGEPTQKVKLKAIPISQNWEFGKEDIEELLFMLQDSPNTLCRPSRVRKMFASRACRKSVMIGTPLSISDMRRLVNHMGVIEQPWNCPHGRPTMRHLVNLSLLH